MSNSRFNVLLPDNASRREKFHMNDSRPPPHYQSACRQDLTGGDVDVALQALGIELQVDLGIQRAGKITLDHQAAEAAFAPDLHPWTELLAPFERQRLRRAAPS